MNEKDEKELQKHEEKYRRDPLGTIIWAVILIWAGVVMLANNLGFLDRFNIRGSGFPFSFPFAAEVWPLIFLGAGVILLVEILLRLTIPKYRRPIMGTFTLAVVFFGLGLDNWGLIWPIALIAAGASILLRGLFRR